MPNPKNYVADTAKLMNMNMIANLCMDGQAADKQIEQFVDDLRSMKKAYDLGELTGAAKTSYEDLMETLKAPENETVLHKKIKERAMDAFTKMAGDLDSEAAVDADDYSALYKSVSNENRINRERTGYEQKRLAEDQYNSEMRRAIKVHDRVALEQAKREREESGFAEVRKQIRDDGYEQGKLFQSCTEVLKYLAENKKTDDKTEAERNKFKRIEKLRQSHLFLPYMGVVYDINKDKEKIIYEDKNMQDALKQSKQEEKEKKVADFIKNRDEHVDYIMRKFQEYEVLKTRLIVLNNEKKPDRFSEMIGQIKKFDEAKNKLKWDDPESYKNDCLYDKKLNYAGDQFKAVLPKLEDYINHQQRKFFLGKFFQGKLGKERLERAKQMRKTLNKMSTEMVGFKGYRDARKEELYEVMSNPKKPEIKQNVPALKPAEKQNMPYVKKVTKPKTLLKNTFTLHKLEKPMKKEIQKPAVPFRKRSNSLSASPAMKKAEFKNANQKKLNAYKAPSKKQPAKKKTASVLKKTGLKKTGLKKTGIKKTGIKKNLSSSAKKRQPSKKVSTAKKAGTAKKESQIKPVNPVKEEKLSSYSKVLSIVPGPALECTKNSMINIIERKTEVKAEKSVSDKKVREQTTFEKLREELQLSKGERKRYSKDTMDLIYKPKQLNPPAKEMSR